jgi:glutamate dehydrogenase (NAD(P)+)
MPDINEEEISLLARGMTLKFGFLGLPHGGAKAGIIGNPEAPNEERKELLIAFGRAIAPLIAKRIYIPSMDMGTEINDIRHIIESAGVDIKQREFKTKRSGHFTALTVFTGVKKATERLGLNVSECTVAIEGFGKVGTALGELLSDAKARVVAISTSRGAIYNPKGLDMERLSQLAKEKSSGVVDIYDDAERIDRESLLEIPVDILCPCARHYTIHAGNAHSISAKIICPGANSPVTDEAEHILFERGVLCLPYFVTNSGGVLGGTMEFASVNKKKIEEFIDLHIGSRIASILDEAYRRKLPSIEIAEDIALRHFNKVCQASAQPKIKSKLFELALDLHRRGLVPGPIVGSLAPRYFERILP